MLIVYSSSSLRSRRQHRDWGLSPRKAFVNLCEPVKRAAGRVSITTIAYRPLGGLARPIALPPGVPRFALHPRLYAYARVRGLRDVQLFVNPSPQAARRG